MMRLELTFDLHEVEGFVEQEDEAPPVAIKLTVVDDGIVVEARDKNGVEMTIVVVEYLRPVIAAGETGDPQLVVHLWDVDQVGNDPTTTVLATRKQLEDGYQEEV